MKETEIQDELASIRSIMERSSKFISLSGLSGILAGVYALVGAAFAYRIMKGSAVAGLIDTHYHIGDDIEAIAQAYQLLFVAILVLIASVITGLILTRRKAKQKGQPVWGSTSKAVLFHLTAPLATGGILILIFINRGYYGIAAPASLIFYGLALVSASSFTLTMVKYLGFCELLLGLIAACLPGYGLLFWAIGFGALHIIYGSLMYLKYDT